MRQGVVDLLAKPFTADDLSDRLQEALQKQSRHRRRRHRVRTLRKAVKRLNEARKMVTRKVDLLCNDLIGAYSDLSRQFQTVRLQEGYKALLGNTTDLEQLLCHTMDWLMRQVGYSNVGVWLAADDNEFTLGAYMKYTIAGDPELTQALERNLVRMAVRKGFVRIKGPEIRELLTPPEVKILGEQDVIAVNCTYLGDTLGVIVLFRDAKTPFGDDDVAAVKTVSPLFASMLTRAVKSADGGPAEEPETGPDDRGEGDSKLKPRERKEKIDPADWWKRGEAPPF
jgi:hypothetical protein